MVKSKRLLRKRMEKYPFKYIREPEKKVVKKKRENQQ